MARPLINEKLFDQFEKEGREVSYVYRGEGKKKIKIKANIIDPLIKLYEKRFISKEELDFANVYSEDFEISLQTNHFQAAISDIPAGTSKYCFEDIRIQSSKRVQHIKDQVLELTDEKVRKALKAASIMRGKQIKTRHERVLEYIFEKRISERRTERETGINHEDIVLLAKEISYVILKYYKN